MAFRPRKRPRLHFIGSATPEPDDELNIARDKNDRLLKTRFESIFQRYEKDFTGIGDEIGLISGTIEVDNGHLRSMKDDRDTGETATDLFKSDGRRLLRAMTVVPSENASSVSGADEVMQSIETIAGHVFDDYSSEDELFDTGTPAQWEEHESSEQEEEEEEDDDDDDEEKEYENATMSEPDSLFEHRAIQRSPSVDPLFNPTRRSEGELEEAILARTLASGLVDESIPFALADPHRETTQEFIRDELRRILSEQKQIDEETKVEPAWRIPVHLPSPTVQLRSRLSESLPRIASTNRSPALAADEGDDLDMGPDLWKFASNTRRPAKVVAAEKNSRRLKAESEDPLQEGFSSDAEDDTEPAQHSPLRTSIPHSIPRVIIHRSVSARSVAGRSLAVRASYQTSPVERSSNSVSFNRSASPQPRPSNETSSARSPVPSWVRQSLPQQIKWRSTLTRGSPIGHSPSLILPEPEALPLSSVPDHRRVRTSDDDEQGLEAEQSLSKPDETDASANVTQDLVSFAHSNHHDQGVAADTIIVSRESHPETKKRKRRRRSGPRLSNPETPEDKSKHPWQDPKTKSGNVKRPQSKRKYQTTIQPEHIDKPAGQVNPFDNDLVLAELARKRISEAAEKGECFYCNARFAKKFTYSVMSHWDRILINFASKLLPFDDPHDIKYLHSIRSKVERRIRPKKTYLCDFRLMVELHEGNDLSFQQISASQLLYCKKNPAGLESEYRMYRHAEAHSSFVWKEVLEAGLMRLLDTSLRDNPKITMVRFHRELGRQDLSYVDLGNKLAQIFLTRMQSRSDPFRDQLQMYGARVTSPQELENGPNVLPEEVVNLEVDNVSVKLESDDDLFHR